MSAALHVWVRGDYNFWYPPRWVHSNAMRFATTESHRDMHRLFHTLPSRHMTAAAELAQFSSMRVSR